MMNRFFGLNFDFAGAFAAALCAVHCTIIPIMASVGLASGSTHSHAFDFCLMGIGVLIAGFVLVKDAVKSHSNYFPLILAMAGFVVLFIGIESHGEYFYLNIMGGVMVVISHLLNWKLTHNGHLA